MGGMKAINDLSVIDPKKLFLIDGFGALLSAFLLGFVLVRFESIFGMPAEALYILAALPCIFAVYDFSCYFLVKRNGPLFLRLIAIANLLYCCISIGFVLHHQSALTTLGWVYFLLELIIVISLSGIELRVAARWSYNQQGI